VVAAGEGGLDAEFRRAVSRESAESSLTDVMILKYFGVFYFFTASLCNNGS
jgi:hypothetical protein